MALSSANNPTLWLTDKQRSRMERSIEHMLRSELSMDGDPRDLSPDDPTRQLQVFEKLSLVLNACRNKVVPINRLPQDITHRIFSILLRLDAIHKLEPMEESYLVDSINQRERLRLVSRTWNSFIVSTPVFWSLVDIIAPNVEVLSNRLERAQQLALCLTDPAGSTQEDPKQLAMFLSPYFPRVRTLRVGMGEVASAFLESPFPALRTLELKGADWPIITQGHFLELHTLRLDNCFLPPNPMPFSTVRILHICNIDCGAPEILAFLAHIPDLEELGMMFVGHPPWAEHELTEIQLHNLRKLETMRLGSSALLFLFQKVRMPNIKQAIITLSLDADSTTAATVFGTLETLQVLGWGPETVELSISEYAVTCEAKDGRSVEVSYRPRDPKVVVDGFMDYLGPRTLCVNMNLQSPYRRDWAYQALNRRNVVELRGYGGTLKRRRALVDYLALFDQEAEEENEEEEDLELSLPFPSLQTLVFEGGEVDVPHLVQMVSSRAKNSQVTSPRIQQIILINCDTRSSLDLTSRFRALGVDLTVR